LGSLLDQTKNLSGGVEGLWSPLQQATGMGEAVTQRIVDDLASVTSKAIAIPSEDQPVFNTLGSLLGQVKSLPDGVDGFSSPVQHVVELAEMPAQRIVDDISSVASKGIDQLSEVLGGPAPDPGTTTHATDLPATILGAAADSFSAAGQGGGAPLPVPDAAHLDGLNVGAVPTASHADAPALDMPPLQLGFLGQSYVDVADHHDSGAHSLNSPLHGFI
jgi:hypothetical protein